MTDAEYLRIPRVRNLLKRITAGERSLMPCGDQRIVVTLMARGLLARTDPKQREITTSYVLTARGQTLFKGA